MRSKKRGRRNALRADAEQRAEAERRRAETAERELRELRASLQRPPKDG